MTSVSNSKNTYLLYHKNFNVSTLWNIICVYSENEASIFFDFVYMPKKV